MRLQRQKTGDGDDAAYMFHCADCPMSERWRRKCPIEPPDWAALRRRGVRIRAGEPAEVVHADLLYQLRRCSQDWDEGLVGEVREAAEQWGTRALIERHTGKRFGEDQPDLCAWYRLTTHEAPGVVDYLQEVRFDDMGGLVMWRDGGAWDQPADLLDAADVIRACSGAQARKRKGEPEEPQ